MGNILETQAGDLQSAAQWLGKWQVIGGSKGDPAKGGLGNECGDIHSW